MSLMASRVPLALLSSSGAKSPPSAGVAVFLRRSTKTSFSSSATSTSSYKFLLWMDIRPAKQNLFYSIKKKFFFLGLCSAFFFMAKVVLLLAAIVCTAFAQEVEEIQQGSVPFLLPCQKNPSFPFPSSLPFTFGASTGKSSIALEVFAFIALGLAVLAGTFLLCCLKVHSLHSHSLPTTTISFCFPLTVQ